MIKTPKKVVKCGVRTNSRSGAKQYEKLTGEERLYSIRHPNTKKNVRVLYTIVNGTYIILLHAFLEKSSNDYKKAITVAKKRLKWLEDD